VLIKYSPNPAFNLVRHPIRLRTALTDFVDRRYISPEISAWWKSGTAAGQIARFVMDDVQ